MSERMRRPENFESRMSPEKGDTRRFERAPILTARDTLVHALNGETRGSAAVKAIGDHVTQQSTEARLRQLQEQRNPDIGELIQVCTKKAIVEETIRKGKLGKKAGEYKEAFEGAESIYERYLVERSPEGSRKFSKFPNVRVDAAKNLLDDLEEVNAQLPKKGETPTKPK